VGATIDLGVFDARLDAILFGETQSRIIVSCAREDLERMVNAAFPITVLGTTGGGELTIKTSRYSLSWDISSLRDAWWNAIGRLMDV
jgi:phosphoribosylformylglycinamidine (FGAM) synthase-like enzyme